MRAGTLLHIIGGLLVALAISMLIPLAYAIKFGDGDAAAIAWSVSITLIAGLILWFTNRVTAELRIRDGFAIVALGWTAMVLFGSLPFVLSGVCPSFTDAFFETMSGMTTTGATILTDIESVPRGVLFWRSLTHWLGGMGVIVLFLAILPLLGVGGMQLFRAEVPGPIADKLTPRVQDTAKILWVVYVVMTLAETVLLMLGGMTGYDALCHAFVTMATGGFSTKNTSVGHYDSAYIDWVIVVFMFLAGTNFALHFRAFRGEWSSFWHDAEWRVYLAVTLGATAVVTISVLNDGLYNSIADGIRYSAFQVVAICTTTGFGTADYELWAPVTQITLLALMFIGGCAGSTGGGMKQMRIMLLVKQGATEMKKLLHPKAVVPIRLGTRSVSQPIMSNILGLFLIFMLLYFTFSFMMCILGLDLLTALSSVAATMGNIRPGLGDVGPTDDYGWIPPAGKWVLSAAMLLGRLEIYTVLVILTPGFWRP